jgi:sugar-specific transcriptional regulator TrmB
MERIQNLTKLCADKDAKIKELEARIEEMKSAQAKEKKKLNEMIADLEKIGTQDKEMIKKINKKILGKINVELQKKILDESKTISQNLLIQKDMKDDILRQKSYISTLEEKIKEMGQEINISR